MAARKPRKATRAPKSAPKQAETPVEASKAKSGITREIALADVRFGFGHSGFYVTQHYNPDDLIGRKGLKVYTNMRRDEQVKAALLTKKNAIIASGVEVVIDDKDRQDDEALEEQKRFVEFNLAEMDGAIETYLLDALTAFDYGFSITEPVYKKIDYGEWDGKIGWRALKVRRPEQIEFETDQFGNLTEYGIIQGNQPLPAERLAIFTYRKEFGNLYGTSDLREAYRPWFVKDTLIKFMAMCMERYGMPIPVAKTSQTLDNDVKAQLLQIMQNIQARTGIIIPDAIDLQFESPGQGAHAAYPPIFEQLDRWIAMAINVPSLIGAGGGASETGSYARSETEMDTFLLMIEQARRELQEFFNDQIVKRLIDLNFEVNDGVYVKVKFRELTHERKIEILEQMQKLLAGGVITKTTPDEQYARDALGLPELPEDEISVGTREAKEQEQKDQIKLAGDMAKVAPAVPPAPATKDKVPGRNPFAPKQAPGKFEQRDDLPRVPGGHLFAGQNDAPRDFDEKCLNGMIKRGQSLGYDEESLNFVAGFMSAPASKYQSLNEMAERGKALGMEMRTIEFAMGFLCESLDLEKRTKAKEKLYHADHDQEDHGNWADGLSKEERDAYDALDERHKKMVDGYLEDAKWARSQNDKELEESYLKDATRFLNKFILTPEQKKWRDKHDTIEKAWKKAHETALGGKWGGHEVGKRLDHFAILLKKALPEFSVAKINKAVDPESFQTSWDAVDWLTDQALGIKEQRKSRGLASRIARDFSLELYHLPGQHDQEDHGNRGGGLVDTAVKKGGFTYNPIRMKGRRPPKNGFALSVRKDTEKVIDLNAKREAIKAEMVKYVKDNWETIKAQGNFLGGWVDQGKLYIDISNVVADKNEAIEKARKADQLAIFDLEKGETIEIKKAA